VYLLVGEIIEKLNEILTRVAKTGNPLLALDGLEKLISELEELEEKWLEELNERRGAMEKGWNEGEADCALPF